MTNEELFERRRQHAAHMASVPGAIERTRQNFTDVPSWSDLNIVADDVRTVLAEVERLQAEVKQLRQDMREEQREFQREAREIAAEAFWSERERNEGGGW